MTGDKDRIQSFIKASLEEKLEKEEKRSES